MEALLAFRSFSTFFCCSTSFGQDEKRPVSTTVVTIFTKASVFHILYYRNRILGEVKRFQTGSNYS